MSKKPETLFREKFVKKLKSIPNLTYFSIQSVAIRGIPDILLCYKGKFVAVELKSKLGKPSKLQEYNLEKIRGSGGVGLLVYPENELDFWITLNNL